MKKILILFFLLCFINFASAEGPLNLTLSRSSYNIKETLQAELVLGVNPVNQISEYNFLLRDKNNQVIPISLFLEKLSNIKYFIYFNMPEINDGNYYFEVRDIRYISQEDGVLKQANIKKQFELLNYTLDNYSISIFPGIILKKSSLTIVNNKEPLEIEIISPDFTNLSKKTLLVNNLLLNVVQYNEDYQIKIAYGNKEYLIPVLGSKNNISNQTSIQPRPEPEKNSIIFLNSTFGNYFSKEILINEQQVIYNPFYIKNIWGYEINNLSFVFDGNLNKILKLDKYNIKTIRPNETIRQIAILNEDKNFEIKNYFGNINIFYNGNILSSLELKIRFLTQDNLTKNETIPVKPAINYSANDTISIKPDEKKGSSLIIIIIVVVLVILFLYWLFKGKVKKTETFREHFYKFKP